MPTITTKFVPDQQVRVALPTRDGESFVVGRIRELLVERDANTGAPVAGGSIVSWRANGEQHSMLLDAIDLTPVNPDAREVEVEVPYAVGDWVRYTIDTDRLDHYEDEEPVVDAIVRAVILTQNAHGAIVAGHYRVAYSVRDGMSLVTAELDELAPLTEVADD